MLVLRHQFDELEEVESKVSTKEHLFYMKMCVKLYRINQMSYALTILGAPCPRVAIRLPSAMSR